MATANWRNRLSELACEWRTDLYDRVIPFWLKHSLDNEHGGYYTCLDAAGERYDDTKYMWLNGRQVYMLSRLYVEGRGREGGVAARSMRRRIISAKGKGIRWHSLFSMTKSGEEKLHFQRKPYAGVFYSMACLYYYKALVTYETEHGGARYPGEVRDATHYFSEALEMYEKCLAWIADPKLCGKHPEGGDDGSGLSSCLADHMCIASMTLEIAGIAPLSADKMDSIMSGIHTTISALKMHVNTTDAGNTILMEFMKATGPDESTPRGRLFNPGHSIEVGWFLHMLAESANDDSAKTLALDVIEGSLMQGWDYSRVADCFTCWTFRASRWSIRQ